MNDTWLKEVLLDCAEFAKLNSMKEIEADLRAALLKLEGATLASKEDKISCANSLPL